MAAPFIKPRVPRGMRDILPEQMIRRQYVIDVIRDVFEEFGFEPLQTPALELSEVLTGKYGPDAEKLIYQADIQVGRRTSPSATIFRCRSAGLLPCIRNCPNLLSATKSIPSGERSAHKKDAIANSSNAMQTQ